MLNAWLHVRVINFRIIIIIIINHFSLVTKISLVAAILAVV